MREEGLLQAQELRPANFRAAVRSERDDEPFRRLQPPVGLAELELNRQLQAA